MVRALRGKTILDYGVLPAAALLLTLFLLPRAKGMFAALTWTLGLGDAGRVQ